MPDESEANPVSDLLHRAAQALAGDPTLMAAALCAYRQQRGIDDAALAACLKLPPERLSGLALCRQPDPLQPAFAGEVAALATYIGCDPQRLYQVLQAVDARVDAGHTP